MGQWNIGRKDKFDDGEALLFKSKGREKVTSSATALAEGFESHLDRNRIGLAHFTHPVP